VGISVSCSSPNPPNFIEKIEIVNSVHASPFKKAVCLTVNQEALWENQNQFDALQNHLISTMKLQVDNNLKNEFYLVTPALTVIRNKTDEKGNLIGTYTDPYTACFNIENITTGLHIADFRIKSVSGIEYVYGWIFTLN
jgi:hypothetical protein